MTGTVIPSHGSESSVGVFGAKLTSPKLMFANSTKFCVVVLRLFTGYLYQSLCIGNAWFEASGIVSIFEHSAFICYIFVCSCTVSSLAV